MTTHSFEELREQNKRDIAKRKFNNIFELTFIMADYINLAVENGLVSKAMAERWQQGLSTIQYDYAELEEDEAA